MYENVLKQDKTYFVLANGEVKTLYKAEVDTVGLKIICYDRASVTGTSILNIQEVSCILTKFSENYNDRLREFFKFIANDMGADSMLYKYIHAIWVCDIEGAEIYTNMDTALQDKFMTYMEYLTDIEDVDRNIAYYFNEVHCIQEIVYSKLDINWYKWIFKK